MKDTLERMARLWNYSKYFRFSHCNCQTLRDPLGEIGFRSDNNVEDIELNTGVPDDVVLLSSLFVAYSKIGKR